MKLINEYPVKIYENKYDDKKYYKMGLSKKDINGNYINGYIDCRFRKDVEVDASKKIYIQDAWLDFYISDKKTKPYVFVNKFEYVSDVVKQEEQEDPWKDMGTNINTDEIVLEDKDLPF